MFELFLLNKIYKKNILVTFTRLIVLFVEFLCYATWSHNHAAPRLQPPLVTKECVKFVFA
jgi:hypothetical protein